METKSIILVLYLILFLVFEFAFISTAGQKESFKKISIHQSCQLYLDEPMIADDLYGGKKIKSSVNVSDKRRIRSLCPNAQEGTFTAEIIAKENYVVECVCNSPKFKTVFDQVGPGDVLSIQGTFKSMTSAFFEGNTKRCKVTIYGCSFEISAAF